MYINYFFFYKLIIQLPPKQRNLDHIFDQQMGCVLQPQKVVMAHHKGQHLFKLLSM